MIKRYEKFRLPDENKRKELLLEVNWAKDSKIDDCKILRLTFPNGDQMHLKKEYLNSVLFALGTAEEQRKMIPQRISRVKWYETVVSVKATQDIKRGEQVTFPIKLSLPSAEEEAIAEIKREKQS